jgi:hypothetical protein
MLVAAALVALVLAAPAGATLPAPESLTYLPFGFVHDEKPVALLDETLSQLSSYGIGQALLPLPKFKKDGTLKLSKHELKMIPLWAQRTTAYDTAHDAEMTLVAVFQGRVKKASLNLEDPAVRARILSGIETVLAMGVQGLQLDFEPYPTSAGYIRLLEEINGAFARRGFTGRLSVCAPANRSTWSPAYMAALTSQLSQVDPLFYDSERRTAASYESWVREGLAYYSANSSPASRLIPVIPAYGPNRWHLPEVENIANASAALEGALAEGSRVQGAGLFWWWGFYYEEEGAYDPTADQLAWQGSTRGLSYAP